MPILVRASLSLAPLPIRRMSLARFSSELLCREWIPEAITDNVQLRL
jgi:hypothetical protein